MSAQVIFPLEIWPENIQQARFPANDNALRLEAALGPAISVANSEPGSPSDGDQHIVGTTWGGFAADSIVVRRSGTWLEFAPFEGLLKAIGSSVYRYDGAGWVEQVSGGIQSIVAGDGIAVDNTDPENPVVSATGGGGGGLVVQRVHSQTSTSATGTTTIPWDNTIPQNTEGTQFQSQSFTPTDAANILVIEAQLCLGTSNDNRLIAALFKSGTANALAAWGNYMQTANGHTVVQLRAEMVAGTTSAITFTTRAGQSVAGTTTFNGSNGAQVFGGVANSWITITEYLP